MSIWVIHKKNIFNDIKWVRKLNSVEIEILKKNSSSHVDGIENINKLTTNIRGKPYNLIDWVNEKTLGMENAEKLNDSIK